MYSCICCASLSEIAHDTLWKKLRVELYPEYVYSFSDIAFPCVRFLSYCTCPSYFDVFASPYRFCLPFENVEYLQSLFPGMWFESIRHLL
jgi:hypothetical protein